MLIAASGTVTLESAIIGTPTIVSYKVSPLTYLLAKALIKIPYASLTNLIIGREVFPELLQGRCDGTPLADKALEWLLPSFGKHPMDEIRRELAEVRNKLGEPGASDRAADVLLSDLRSLAVDASALL